MAVRVWRGAGEHLIAAPIDDTATELHTPSTTQYERLRHDQDPDCLTRSTAATRRRNVRALKTADQMIMLAPNKPALRQT